MCVCLKMGLFLTISPQFCVRISYYFGTKLGNNSCY
eukprot:UN22960